MEDRIEMQMRNARASRRGFTLIELMAVVVLIALLAVIAMVQLGRARVTTNEYLAIQSLRTLAKSCQLFSITRRRFPTALTELGSPASTPPYLTDPALLGDGTQSLKQGYRFQYASTLPDTFTIIANPQSYGVTGGRHFYTDESLTIRATDENRDATATDPVLP